MDVVAKQPGYPANLGVVRNAWYVVAFSHELRERPLARHCCDEAIVLFRTAGGSAAALSDRCPHRGVPLSLGAVAGEGIRCAYHGIEFAPDGRCARIPTQERIPPQMKVRSYPVIEKGTFVWIWPGDPDRADPTLLPDHHALGLERVGWTTQPYFMLEAEANYGTPFENMLDTSHISFLHGTAIDSGRMATAPSRSEHDGNVVRFIRTLKDDLPNEGTAAMYGLEEGVPFDRELTSAAMLPNLHIIKNTFSFPSKAGHPEHIRINVMPITPARRNTFYQFLTMTTSYPEDHPEFLIKRMYDVLYEDKVVLEAAQRLYEQSPDLPEVNVRADVGALRARRRLNEMVQEERADAP